MKKYITFICVICATLFLDEIQAQIGIQTENPLSVLHIDPKRDTNTTGSINTSDDVVITSAGNVGIGVVAPTEKLDIRGTFRLRDGNQAVNKVLVSDALGNAQWSDRPKLDVLEVNNINTLLSGKTFTTTPSYSGIAITLSKGTWQVMFQVVCNASSNVYWDFCTSSTAYSLTEPVNRRAVSSARTPASVNAIYFVSLTVATTYYIWVTTRSGTATYRAGGTLWALPID